MKIVDANPYVTPAEAAEIEKAHEIAALLTHLPTYNLIRIGRIIDRGVARIAQKVGIGAPELRVLFLIGRMRTCTLSEAIQFTTINHGNTSRVAAGLLEEGYLERIPDNNDLRKKKLRITEKGNAIINQAYPLRVVLDHQILAGFSQSEVEMLNGYLKRISETVYNSQFLDNLEEEFDAIV